MQVVTLARNPGKLTRLLEQSKLWPTNSSNFQRNWEVGEDFEKINFSMNSNRFEGMENCDALEWNFERIVVGLFFRFIFVQVIGNGEILGVSFFLF